MLSKVLQFLVLLFPVFLTSHAFWWRSHTTEPPAPAPPVMKQIPLTYFRTYTYQQPMPRSNQMPFPLLSSTDYIQNFGALGNSPYLNPMMPPVMHLGMPTNNEISVDVKPEKSYSGNNAVRSLGGEITPPLLKTTTEPTTTTTTTTTTTSTPAPTTTTTTTTEAPTSAASEPDGSLNVEATYPAFNRKVFTNHFNINYNRPAYPYPEYSLYKSNSPSSNEEHQLPPNVELVPCMCPINIQNNGFPSPFQANPSNSIFLAQGRTNIEAEDFDLPQSHQPLNMELQSTNEAANLVEDLEMLKFIEDEQTATQSNLA